MLLLAPLLELRICIVFFSVLFVNTLLKKILTLVSFNADDMLPFPEMGKLFQKVTFIDLSVAWVEINAESYSLRAVLGFIRKNSPLMATHEVL